MVERLGEFEWQCAFRLGKHFAYSFLYSFVRSTLDLSIGGVGCAFLRTFPLFPVSERNFSAWFPPPHEK